MRLSRFSEYRRMPWKNGRGETAEIAVFPDGPGSDDFGWRLSMATVADSGPFSSFPGIDRTLCIVAGDGLELSLDGISPVRLTPDSPPHSFPGDVPTMAKLLGGPVRDLNVMTRRGRFSHSVARLPISGPMELDVADASALICASGMLHVDALGAGLQPLDSLLDLLPGPLAISGQGLGLLIRLRQDD